MNLISNVHRLEIFLLSQNRIRSGPGNWGRSDCRPEQAGDKEGKKNTKSHPLVGRAHLFFQLNAKFRLSPGSNFSISRFHVSPGAGRRVCPNPLTMRAVFSMKSIKSSAVVIAARSYVRWIAEKQFSVSVVSHTREKFRSSALDGDLE